MAGTIADKIQAILASKADIAAAIEEKGVIVPQKLSEYGNAIRALPSSVEEQEPDLQFVDYDGTVLYKYTYAEAMELIALPAVPTHDGLNDPQWNYTLQEIRGALGTPNSVTFAQVADYFGLSDNATFDDLKTLLDLTDNDTLESVAAEIPELFVMKVIVGCTYTIPNGATRLHVTIPDDNRTLVLVFKQSSGSSVTISWGDGASETPSSTDNRARDHVYAAGGDYVVSLTPRSSASVILDGNIGGSGATVRNGVFKKVELGRVSAFSMHAFGGCDNLESVLMSRECSAMGANAMSSVSSIKTLVIPRTITSISASAFYANPGIVKVSIPPTATSIGYNAFCECPELKILSAPGVTTLTRQASDKKVSTAFKDCSKLKEVYLPSLQAIEGTQAFYNCSLLETVVAPQLHSLYGNSFQTCNNLKYLRSGPVSLGSGNYVFSECLSLLEPPVIAPVADADSSNVPTIGQNCFANCKKLRKLVIAPNDSSVALSIGAAAFKDSGITVFDFTACTRVPSLNSSGFSGTPSDKRILVPASLTVGQNTWQGATNWSAFPLESTIQEFNSSTSYAVGTFCSHNGIYYKRKTAGSGSWDSSKWEFCTGVIVAV
jgi:hypothetical protein